MVLGPLSSVSDLRSSLNTQSRHKDPKILGGIFQSFDDGQNKILFRALIRKNKRPVGWHEMPRQMPSKRVAAAAPLYSAPLEMAEKTGLRKVLLAGKLWWETEAAPRVWSIAMRICDSLRTRGSRGQESGRHGGPRPPWVVVVAWSPLDHLEMQNTFDNLYLLARLPCVINYQIEIAFDSPTASFPRPSRRLWQWS